MNNDSTRKQEQSEQALIGKHLASERLRREISVRQVAEQIKLPAWVIEALESDRLDRIAPIYLRGYIRNYARFLNLDPEPLLVSTDQAEHPELRNVLPVKQPAIRFERWIKFSTYLLVTTLIVPPLVYFFVVGGVRVFEAEVVDANSPPAMNVSQRISEALALAEPEDDDAEAGHMAASAAPLNNLRPLEDRSNPMQQPSALLAESLEAATEDFADNLPALSTLVLELTEDSWIEIESADGQRLEFDLLRAGSQHRYEALAPFTLLLGRANAVQITLDGELQQFSGQEQGSVLELTLGDSASTETDSNESG